MHISIAHDSDLRACAARLQSELVSPASLIVFFASPAQDLACGAQSLRQAFPTATVVGCSSSGEISSGKMADGSATAMAVPVECVAQAAATYIEDLRSPAAIEAGLADLARQLGASLSEVDHSKHVGLVLVDGLSGAEEQLMEKIGDLTDIPFVGGSAGDDLAFRKTSVSLNGQVWNRGAVLALLRVLQGFSIVKTQSFRATGKVLTATQVDPATRTVLEFNGQPAAAAYSAALGIPAARLPEFFMSHPLGLMVDGEPFVRSPQRVTEGGEVVFFCNIQEGMELEILESTDIVAETKSVLEEVCGLPGSVAGILNFNCILRTLELKAKGQSGDYGNLFAGIPTIGFSTYGEEYVGHINQTATMLVFRRQRV